MENTQIAENERAQKPTGQRNGRGKSRLNELWKQGLGTKKGELKKEKRNGRGPIPWLFTVRCARP